VATPVGESSDKGSTGSSGGSDGSSGNGSSAAGTGSRVHNFTESGLSSTYFTITGNLATNKGTASYAGLTLTQCLKMESSTEIKFTTTHENAKIILVFGESTPTIKLNGVAQEGSNGIIELNLDKARTYTLSKRNSCNLFYMEVTGDEDATQGGSDGNGNTGDNESSGDNTGDDSSGDEALNLVWKTVDGKKYWYEDGVKQGTQNRGKEIFDPATNAWYFLDEVQGGAMATSKDVIQPTNWEEYNADPTGYEQRAAQDASLFKWVRYDADGKMVKGWCAGDAKSAKTIEKASDAKNEATYYFDLTTGEMAKGDVVINNVPCHFDEASGIGAHYEWVEVNGVQYWYENGERQGVILNDDKTPNLSYRGKEVYATDLQAWCWLDNVDYGKRAVSKDVYQESQADDAGTIGKWVRYDSEGRMIKGWSAGYGETARQISSPSEANGDDVYYFDWTYGTMAKGTVTIDGVKYTFDDTTGILVQ
jgi:hypothetical protein